MGGLLAPRRPTPPRVDGRYLAPKVNGAVGLNPSKGPGYSTATNASSASSTSPTHSYGAPAPPPSEADSAAAGTNLNSQSSADPPAEDLYADIEGEEELLARAQNPLPTLSADGLRALAQKQDADKNESSLPPLSASGLAKLAELYNPEDVTEDDDEEEGLVIDTAKQPEDPMKDTEKISEDEDEQIRGNTKFKIQLKSNNKMVKTTLTESPKKKNLIADIFGSDNEEEEANCDNGKQHLEGATGSSEAAEQPPIRSPKNPEEIKNIADDKEAEEDGDKVGTTVEDLDNATSEAAINEIINAAVNAATLVEREPLKEDASLEDVSDKEMVNDKEDAEESREVRMRELSVSPINSDQSESFEKAATLEGLNPEAISPEEDFTSLSEEEEGEIKNYERRKKLKLRKKELQRKVRELERQVIEISPSRAAVIANGGNLEDGEINEEKKRKTPKEKEKAKKKVKKDALDDAPNESKKVDETLENNSKPSRSYRKKEAGEEDKDEEKEGVKVKPARRKKKEKNNAKPELPRYDVRRILDKKKEEKKEKKEKVNKDGDKVGTTVEDLDNAT